MTDSRKHSAGAGMDRRKQGDGFMIIDSPAIGDTKPDCRTKLPQPFISYDTESARKKKIQSRLDVTSPYSDTIIHITI